MGILLRCHGGIDVAENVVEFADRSQFEGFVTRQDIGFLFVEKLLEPIAELIGKFE
jgi:hypothetical protein